MYPLRVAWQALLCFGVAALHTYVLAGSPEGEGEKGVAPLLPERWMWLSTGLAVAVCFAAGWTSGGGDLGAFCVFAGLFVVFESWFVLESWPDRFVHWSG